MRSRNWYWVYEGRPWTIYLVFQISVYIIHNLFIFIKTYLNLYICMFKNYYKYFSIVNRSFYYVSFWYATCNVLIHLYKLQFNSIIHTSRYYALSLLHPSINMMIEQQLNCNRQPHITDALMHIAHSLYHIAYEKMISTWMMVLIHN